MHRGTLTKRQRRESSSVGELLFTANNLEFLADHINNNLTQRDIDMESYLPMFNGECCPAGHMFKLHGATGSIYDIHCWSVTGHAFFPACFNIWSAGVLLPDAQVIFRGSINNCWYSTTFSAELSDKKSLVISRLRKTAMLMRVYAKRKETKSLKASKRNT